MNGFAKIEEEEHKRKLIRSRTYLEIQKDREAGFPLPCFRIKPRQMHRHYASFVIPISIQVKDQK